MILIRLPAVCRRYRDSTAAGIVLTYTLSTRVQNFCADYQS
jgi:hypothetical protein